MKFYINKITNEIINSINNIDDENYILLTANIVDASLEKHIPVYSINDGKIYIKVGEVDHPMINEHYIMWIALVNDSEIQKINLKPGDKPEALFEYRDNSTIYAYCNLHGLWKNDIK